MRPAAGAADQRPQPRQQFFRVKRFDQIIIGSGFQPLNLVLPATTGGQDQHRKRAARRPPAPDDLDTRQIGQAEIYDRRIQWVLLANVQPGKPLKPGPADTPQRIEAPAGKAGGQTKGSVAGGA